MAVNVCLQHKKTGFKNISIRNKHSKTKRDKEKVNTEANGLELFLYFPPLWKVQDRSSFALSYKGCHPDSLEHFLFIQVLIDLGGPQNTLVSGSASFGPWRDRLNRSDQTIALW